LDAPCHAKPLFDALAGLLGERLQDGSSAARAPLLEDLAPHYAVNVDVRKGPLPSRGSHAKRLPSVVDATRCVAGYHHLFAIGRLILDDVADV
jgi:hypothetical protein